MLKKLLIFLLVLVGLVFIIGHFLPKDIHVERSVRIEAPAATAFTLLNGYSTFNQWSPWADRDPEASYTYSGPKFGPGSAMSWQGNEQVGSGSQEIMESSPYEMIRTQLDFGPQGSADAYFQIRSTAENTVDLTWGFDTDVTRGQSYIKGLIGRYFGLMFDRWIGADYERGLSAFKSFAESFPRVDFSDLDVNLVNAQALDILYVSSQSTQQPEAIAAALADAYAEVAGFMADSDIEFLGMPMAIARYWDEEGYGFDAAIPARLPDGVELTGNVQVGRSPSGSAARAVHYGAYEGLTPSYEKLLAWINVHGYTEGDASWEHYITDPAEVAESDLITHIYFLVDE